MQARNFLLLISLIVLSSASDAKCGSYTNCTECAADGECVWCANGRQPHTLLTIAATGYCMSGTMFGPDAKDLDCPTLKWSYRQCSVSGFWAIFIAALLIFVIVLVIVVVLIFCFRRKAVKGNPLLGINSESNKVHTLPLDVLIEKQSSAGLGIGSLSDDGEDHVLGSPVQTIATNPLKVALSVPEVEEAQEEMAPPLREIGPWKEYQDDSGKYYYYNEETTESVWDPPPQFKYSDEFEYTPEQEEYIANNTGRYLVRALYPYTATKPELWQLSFEEGDLIWVVDSHHEEDWWVGELASTGEQGYFARSYVQVLKRTFKTNTKQGAKISELTNELRQSGLK